MVIAIIAILAAILFPVFAQAREKARAISCISNEKQIGSAMMMYAQDYDEGLPAWSERWEIPDRHNGGANYVFCDGHAKYLLAKIAYPSAVNPVSPTTAELKAAYFATGTYFAYTDAERQAWLNAAQ